MPRKLTNPPRELVFGMKPPQGVRNYRKKIRPFKRKCRSPESEIKIGLFILRLECNAAGSTVKKIQRKRVDDKVRAARLADLVSKLTHLRNRVQVPINAWKSGRTDLGGLVKAPASPQVHGITRDVPQGITKGISMPPAQGIRVKSELKMVTETCTTPITTVTSSPKVTHKVNDDPSLLDELLVILLYSPGEGRDPSGVRRDQTYPRQIPAHHSDHRTSQTGAYCRQTIQTVSNFHHVTRTGKVKTL